MSRHERVLSMESRTAGNKHKGADQCSRVGNRSKEGCSGVTYFICVFSNIKLSFLICGKKCVESCQKIAVEAEERQRNRVWPFVDSMKASSKIAVLCFPKKPKRPLRAGRVFQDDYAMPCCLCLVLLGFGHFALCSFCRVNLEGNGMPLSSSASAYTDVDETTSSKTF